MVVAAYPGQVSILFQSKVSESKRGKCCAIIIVGGVDWGHGFRCVREFLDAQLPLRPRLSHLADFAVSRLEGLGLARNSTGEIPKKTPAVVATFDLRQVPRTRFGSSNISPNDMNKQVSIFQTPHHIIADEC